MTLNFLRIKCSSILMAITLWFSINTMSATVYTVTVTSDNPFTPATGSLRWAINQVNAGAGTGDIINFNISGAGTHTITLAGSLPVIVNSVTIDGTTQSGYQTGSPVIIIESPSTSNIWDGLAFYYTSNYAVKGVHLRNFYFGLSTRNDGQSVDSYTFLIEDNVLTANNFGLVLGRDINSNTKNITVQGNFIDANGCLSQSLSWGVLLDGSNCPIGGTAAGAPNTIVNHETGVRIFSWIGSDVSLNNPVTLNTIYSSVTNHKAIDLVNGSNNNKPSPGSLSYSSGVLSGTAQANDRIEIFGGTDGQNANVLRAVTNANGSGNWSVSVSTAGYNYLTTTATDQLGSQSPDLENTSELSSISTGCASFSVTVSSSSDTICRDSSATLTASGATSYTWQPATGLSSTTGASVTASPSVTTTYTVTGISTSCSGTATVTIYVDSCFVPTLPCYNCISSFAPEPGKKYIISAWAREPGSSATKTSFTFPQLFVEFPSISVTEGPFVPAGQIIDGWQRIEGMFTVPDTATNIKINLVGAGGNVLFDDIRVHPFDGMMKSYVYDPTTLRLVAELDERNYATLFEYDEEGKRTRIKKETEKGVMTIEESKSNRKKR